MAPELLPWPERSSFLSRTETQDAVFLTSLNCPEVFRDPLNAGPSLILCRGGPLVPLRVVGPMCVLADWAGDSCPGPSPIRLILGLSAIAWPVVKEDLSPE